MGVMSPELVESSEPTLKRELGLLTVFSIATGAMISSGLFVLPGLAYARAGPAIVLSYGLAALLMIPVMLSKAELGTAMPKAGGSYFYIERSLGPLAGTVAGLANWLSISLKATFALIGIGALATMLFPALGEWGMKAIAVGACAIFSILNLVSRKKTGRLQVVLVFGLLAVIVLYTCTSIRKVDLTRHIPFVPFGWQSVFAVAGMVFVSFGGLTKVVGVSEEIRDPARNLPLGMFLAFGVVSMLYVVVVFVTIGVVEPETLAGSLVPISLGARAAMGEWGVVVVGIGALLAFATTANAGILSASRSPMAMSRDGLLPEVFGGINKRFGTPYVAIMATALFIMAVILLLSVEDLIKTASAMILVMFMLVNLSIIIMRQSGIQNYRPTFRAPFYPWLQIAAIVIYGFLIAEMGRIPLLLTGAFALGALAWYVAYVRRRIDRESAFVYLVKNIISKEIARSGLEDELRTITLERDLIALDRFDRLVKQSFVLDLKGRITAQETFRQLSEALSPRLKMKEDHLFELFLQRERDSSTVVRPGLAIPHIIVEGEHVFDLLLVRCKEGIVFSELHPPVTAAFVLIGSSDERNYHLRALMNIAHIVEEPGFDKRWSAARGAEELRDVVILAKRRREE